MFTFIAAYVLRESKNVPRIKNNRFMILLFNVIVFTFYFKAFSGGIRELSLRYVSLGIKSR